MSESQPLRGADGTSVAVLPPRCHQRAYEKCVPRGALRS
jgi:hypothetical protein